MADVRERIALSVSARIIAGFLAISFTALSATQPTHWVVSWGASPSPPPDAAQIRKKQLEFRNQTLREIVHLSIGGAVIRVRFSNAYGQQSLAIASAHVALRTHESAILPISDRALTFGGVPAISIPPNAVVLSDPVQLLVPDDSDLAVSIFVQHAATPAGMHPFAQQTSYVGPGDLTATTAIPNARPI